jgi:MFS family permease
MDGNKEQDVERTEASNNSPAPSHLDIDPVAEAKLVRKLDFTIYPVFYVLYTMAFLDRINISNAKIQGMVSELDMVDNNHFNIALFIFFVPYILLEVPSNIIIRYVRPSLYLGTLMFMWGIINMCMGFVQSYQQLVGLRILLGVFEAGIMPGIIFVTSFYYKRHEFQKRVSVLFSSTVVAGAFGGLLAYAIAGLGGSQGRAAWRWIFIIEGAVTAFLAIPAMFLIVDWPEQCRYLNADEKELLRKRIAADGGDACRMDTLNKFALRLILTDYKIWLL